MNNHIKINDWLAMQTNLEEVVAEMDKCVDKVFADDKNQTLPGWVLKQFMDLEDCVLEVTND